MGARDFHAGGHRLGVAQRAMRAALHKFLIAMALICVAAAPALAGDHVVRIMTQNMDEGTDFQALLAAQTPGDFLLAVTTTYQGIQATKPAERAKTIARGISKERPDIVGLQEASILRTGTTAPATTVQSDLLQLLLSELENLGEHYRVAAIVPGLDAEAPSTLGFDVRITTQDAILVRGHRDDEHLKVSGNQVQHYLTNLAAPTAVGTTVTLPRGWASIDVTLEEQAFRFVTTHLDIFPAIQLAQVKELIASAGNTSLPVIFSGDFNATTDSGVDPTFPTYQTLIGAGFTDVWKQKRAPDPGFTCCQASDLRNPSSTLNHRIDLILTRGSFGIADIHLIGRTSADKTPSGLWPSDHAGVVADLNIAQRRMEDGRN
jgi:endonuclease/exonuclease/phosphatase family metal-dependent hydrolase